VRSPRGEHRRRSPTPFRAASGPLALNSDTSNFDDAVTFFREGVALGRRAVIEPLILLKLAGTGIGCPGGRPGDRREVGGEGGAA